MSPEALNILDAAMALPESDRVHIAHRLLESVKQPGILSEDDPGFADEIRRRLEDDASETIDEDDAMRRLKDSLAARNTK